MQTTHSSVIFVGRRNAAQQAAREAKIRFVNLAANDPVPEIEHFRNQHSPGAVVPVTEAAVLPAARLRELLALPGNSLACAKRCTDKLAMKTAIQKAGLPCAEFLPVNGEIDAIKLVDVLGLPLVLKACVGSGGRGARVIRAIDEFPLRVSVPHIAEAFVSGTEMSVESFVVDGQPFFVSTTNYVEPKWSNVVPASLDESLQTAVHELNQNAIQALEVNRGMTHMEIFLTKNGPVFGELGARPPGGHLMRLLELAFDFNPWRALLAVEQGQRPALYNTPARHAGVSFIHPDPGIVKTIDGLDHVKQLPALQELKCLVQSGDTISAREGTGQHRGYALFAGKFDEVLAGIKSVRDELRFSMMQ